MTSETTPNWSKAWAEPAHPMIYKLRDDLLAIYKLIREKYQDKIDKAFDNVSKQIGFVVVTSVPCKIEVDGKGVIKQFSLVGENLKGTLFERELLSATEDVKKEKLNISAGTFDIYILWFNALKFKFKTDWMEPAHFRKIIIDRQIGRTQTRVPIHEPDEPAHWFDPGIRISSEETVLISVIDEVYPELRLADKIATVKAKVAQIYPEIHEPAHYRQASSEEMLKQIRKILE
jgi:hypothetical protein